MRRLLLIKVCLLVVLSLASGLAASNETFGQGGKVDTIAPPPKPLPTPAKLDPGKIEGSTYSNEQLGFSFSAPATWTILGNKEMSAGREAAKELFRDEKDPKLKANLEASVERTTALFIASKFAPGTSGGLNAVLICAAERIPTAIVSTPRDYYDLMLHSLNLTEGFKVEVLEPFKLKRIGATEFGTYTIKITSNVGMSIQKQLMAVKGPYAYGLFFTYVENEDASTFAEVVNTVKTR